MRMEEFPAAQAVDVDLADRRVAGVEVGSCFGDVQDPHVPGKLRVQGTADFFEGKRGRALGHSRRARPGRPRERRNRSGPRRGPEPPLQISPSKNLPERPGRCAAGCRRRGAPAPATLRRTSPDTPARASASRRRLWPRPAGPPRYRRRDVRRSRRPFPRRHRDLPQPAGRVHVRGPSLLVRAPDGLRPALRLVRQRVRVPRRQEHAAGRDPRGSSSASARPSSS